MSMVGAKDEISKRYGGVLFDLAQESNVLKSVIKEVALLEQSLESQLKEWRQVVGPTVSVKVQSDIMAKISASLKLSSLMNRFLMILSKNRRLQNLFSILDDFKARSQAAEGLIEGRIETAFSLSIKEIESIQKALKSQLGKDVLLHPEIKENLLGGAILRIGSIMVDASLETQLNKLRQVMKG